MKAWTDDHPKAKLMARKRAAILRAAQDRFLKNGFDGVSMEAIAAAAEVSIMTLYRHAASKEDLFTAVILAACDHEDEAKTPEYAAALRGPLRDLLLSAGDLFQQKLTSAERVAVFRAVIAEAERFPRLAEAAHQHLVQAWEINLDAILAQRPEFESLPPPDRRRLVSTFFHDLIGSDLLRALFGLGGIAIEQHRQWSERAADRLLDDLS